MSKAVFITGTGTDMGKTYLSGLIVKKLAQAGKNPAYYKAAMSGNDRRADGSLIPGDALFVKEMSGISQSLDDMCPYMKMPGLLILLQELRVIRWILMLCEEDF